MLHSASLDSRGKASDYNPQVMLQDDCQHTVNTTVNIRSTYGQHNGQHTVNIRSTYGQHTVNITVNTTPVNPDTNGDSPRDLLSLAGAGSLFNIFINKIIYVLKRSRRLQVSRRIPICIWAYRRRVDRYVDRMLTVC